MNAKFQNQLAYENASRQARTDCRNKSVDNLRMYNDAKAKLNQQLTELQNKYHEEQDQLVREVDDCVAMRNMLRRQGYQPFSIAVEETQRKERQLHNRLRDIKARYNADTRQLHDELRDMRRIYEQNCAELKTELAQRLQDAKLFYLGEMNKCREVAEVEPETVVEA